MKVNDAFLQAVAVSKKYTRESLLGGGALVGKNVTISKIEPIPGGNRVTFSYTLDDGQARTSALDVMDGKDGKPGADGKGILDVSEVSTEGLVDTYRISFSDGTHYDYQVQNGQQGEQGIPGKQGKDGPEGQQGIQGKTGERGPAGYPFLIHKEYADISAFSPDDFPEIGLMFMIKTEEERGFPVYRYTGDPEEPYSYVTSLNGGEPIKGEQGRPGNDGEQGPPGKDGRDGTTYTPRIGNVATVPHGESASASVSVDEDTSEAVFNFSIPEGGQGPQGRPGDTGKDGTTPHIGDNDNWFIGDTDTGVSANGPPGEQGIPGKDGSDGEQGEKGDPGRSITAIRMDDDNKVIVTFSDGVEANIGRLDINVSADFLTSPGFGGLRYYSGRFQYYDKASSTWIDAAATPDNSILVKIAPQAMRSISGTYDHATGHNRLKWLEPEDTIIDGQVICVVEKVSIVRKLGSEPEGMSGGIPVIEVPRKDFGRYADVWYVDESFLPEYGEIWYYKAFPVSTTGFMNSSALNDVPVLCKEAILYGFIIDQNESDPDSMITYIEDNADFTPAHMDYENDVFDYGGWGGAWFIKGLKPCMLNYNGTVAYELDPNDYTKKKDGTPSDVANADFPGNVMVGIPKVYWKIVDNGDDTANVYICDTKLDEGFVCWSHIDNNGNEMDHCYMPCYNGSHVGDKIRSISGNTPIANKTVQQDIDYARANDPSGRSIWYTEVFSDRILINLLLMLIGRTTDTQMAFGNGLCHSGESSIAQSGTMDKKGLFWGDSGIGSGVKVFGMEHYWGNMCRRMAGWVSDHGTQKVKMTYGCFDGSLTEGYNLDGSGYIAIPDLALDGPDSGYVDRFLFFNGAMVPISTNGSGTTYYCDNFNFDRAVVGYALAGNVSVIVQTTGAFRFAVNIPAASTYWNFNSSLSCKPLAQAGGDDV